MTLGSAIPLSSRDAADLREFASIPALRPFQAALAGRAYAPVDILSITDSIGEGQGATTLERRYQSRLRDRLREQFPTSGVAGGRGFIKADWYTNSFTPPAIATGATNVRDRTRGPGGSTYRLKAGGDVTFSGIAGTSFRVFFWLASGGTGLVEVDGVAQTSLTTNPGGTQGALSSSYALTAGNHTIKITQSGSGDVFISGIMVYNGDEAAGIRIWDAGHFGYSSSDLVTSPPANWVGQISNLSLVNYEIGTNDFKLPNSPAVFKSNLQASIDNLRTVVSPPIILTAWVERSDAAATKVAEWQAYVDAMWDIAINDPSGLITVVDLTKRLYPVAGAPSGWYPDAVHPTDRTHALIAENILAAVSPR